MDLVHEVDLAVLLSKLVLGVHEDESHLCCNLGSPLEDSACVCLELLVVLLAHNALSDDLLLGDVLVMTFCSLGGRSYDRLRELLVLDHSFRHLDTADGALACLVLSPCMAREVSADHHFNLERLAFVSDCNHRVRNGDLPVRKDVCSRVKELGCDLVEYLSLERNALGEYYVKC